MAAAEELPTLTYGRCQCGGRYELDPHSADGGPSVEFPCTNAECDWGQTVPRETVVEHLADRDVDLADYRRQEVSV